MTPADVRAEAARWRMPAGVETAQRGVALRGVPRAPAARTGAPLERAEALIRDAGDHAELGEYDAAEACIRRVVELSLSDPDAALVVARHLSNMGLADDAAMLDERAAPAAIRERDEAARARERRQRELAAIEREYRALPARRLGTWHPDDAAIVDLGDRLFTGGIEAVEAGDDLEAGRWLRAAYDIWPTVATAGIFAKIFLDRTPAFERGWRRPPFRVAPRPHIWDGRAPLRGRPLVFLSGGLGDKISELRWVRPLLRHRPVVEVGEPTLVRLAGRLVGPEDVVVSYSDAAPDGPPAALMPASSLYVERGYTVAQLDGREFLTPDPLDVARWRRRIEAHGPGLRVGLAWAAGTSASGANAAGRTIGLATLAPLARIDTIKWFGLQKTTPGSFMPGGYPPEAEPAPPGLHLVRLGPDFADFADTAAAVACLDLVISVDTSIAHLAGALGRPTWLLLSNPLDTRWLVGQSPVPLRSRWYASMRVFMQHRPEGSWAPVVRRVADELRRLVAQRGAT